MKCTVYDHPESILRPLLSERDEGALARLASLELPVQMSASDVPCCVDSKSAATLKNSILKAYLLLVEQVVNCCLRSDNGEILSSGVDDDTHSQLFDLVWTIADLTRNSEPSLDEGMARQFRTSMLYLVVESCCRGVIEQLETHVRNAAKTTLLSMRRRGPQAVAGDAVPEFYDALAKGMDPEGVFLACVERLEFKINDLNKCCRRLKDIERQVGGSLYGR